MYCSLMFYCHFLQFYTRISDTSVPTFKYLLWLFRDLCDRSYQSCSQVDMRLTSTNAHDVRVN